MSFFEWSKGPDSKVGYDVDKAQYKIGGTTYGDYDELVNATLSGGSYIIDKDKDRPQMIYNKSTVGGERVYNLKEMLATNKKSPLSDMISISNNGRVKEATKEPEKGAKVPEVHLVAPVMVHDNQETSIKGNLEQSAVNTLLFSEMNMKVLQNAIQYGVYQRTGILVGEQSPNELMIIVRSIMYQYANFQTSPESVVEEVKRLNVKILLYCIENVSSNALQRKQYLRDLEKLPVPIDRPSYVDKPKNYTYDTSNLLKRN